METKYTQKNYIELVCPLCGVDKVLFFLVVEFRDDKIKYERDRDVIRVNNADTQKT